MLGRLDGKMDQLLSQQSNTDRRLDNHGERLKSLESTKDKGIGIVTASRVAWGAFVGLLAFAIKFVADAH